MAVIESAINWIKRIAADPAHGYDQANRWGPDYDCSSLVISAYKQAGVPLASTYTGNMYNDFLAHGFTDVTSAVNLQTGAGLLPGDVLLNIKSHTGMYIGGGQIVQACINERGTVTGGRTGDQGEEITVSRYFNFPWDKVLRYKEAQIVEEQKGNTYTVQAGDSLWAIADKLLGSGLKYKEIAELNHLKSNVLHIGQVLQIPGVEDRRTVTVTLAAKTYEALSARAAAEHLTLGEIIDHLAEGSK